jgi:hypothetical protein
MIAEFKNGINGKWPSMNEKKMKVKKFYFEDRILETKDKKKV